MEDISRCLKPGGLCIFIDPDLEILAEDKVTILPMALGSHEKRSAGEEDTGPGANRREGSWFQRVLFGS